MPSLETVEPVRRERFFDNVHFRLWRLEAATPFTVGAASEPRVLVCTDGRGQVEYAGGDYAMARGAVTLLPASVGTCLFRPDGVVTLLEIALPEHV